MARKVGLPQRILPVTAVALTALLLQACATARRAHPCGPVLLEVLTPADRVPVRDPRARPERLRDVSDRLFEKVAPRLADKVCLGAAPTPPQ